MLDLEEELRCVLGVLDEAAIPYALCGGLAVAVHGHPRATIDIDLLVREDGVARATDLAGTLGFTFKAGPMTFHDGAVPIHRVTKIDADGDTLMLDMLVVTAQTEQVWLTREVREWSGRPISVVSREGLIALKRLRSSAQDLADIAALTENAP
ncbi:MAG TPA: hypothetical protein VF432_05475 [Thermoanaerobaculia bacterium]